MREFGETVPWQMVLPFAALLLCIAVLPLLFGHFWEQNANKAKVAAALSAPTALYLASFYPTGLAHSALEYVSFLSLLGSLYVISGGIHLSGDLRATPRVNAAFMAVGAVLANVVGTTGASMLLIRVLLRTNRQRQQVGHIPFFFILIVANCGGLLTPLGDPPLFLGYLRGVPFAWTLSLWPYWALANVYLVGLFYWLDRRAYRRERASSVLHDVREIEPLRVDGLINAPLLLAVVGAVFLPTPLREGAMLLLLGLSLWLSPKSARSGNAFSFGPIAEVAILFAGIFITMVPALALLETRGASLGLTLPWHFFLVTGGLSSVLDNAPTYLTFVSAAQGMQLGEGIIGIPAHYLTAISLGAVIMGANTYIGNGPNFMVKAIAEEASVKMPSFFGYAARALLVLTPVYLGLVWSLGRA